MGAYDDECEERPDAKKATKEVFRPVLTWTQRFHGDVTGSSKARYSGLRMVGEEPVPQT
jgi:hypothetical protein